jgi:PAS domain S-box-containing protein
MSPDRPSPLAGTPFPVNQALLNLLDLADQALFVADGAGNVMHGNQAWHRWCQAHAAQGCARVDVLAGRLAPQDRSAMAAAWAGRHPVGPISLGDGGDLVLQPWTSGEALEGWLGRIAPSKPSVTSKEADHLAQRLEMTQVFGRLAAWERRLDGQPGQWDEHMFRFFGLPVQQQPPDPHAISQLVHPEDRDRVRQAWEASSRSAGVYHIHYRVTPRTGGLRMVHSLWRVLNDEQGRPERAVGVLVDDTEGFELGLQMRKLAAQFDMAVELGELFIWVHDLATDTLRFNARAAVLLGLDSTVPHPVAEVRDRVHPEDRAALVEGVQRALQGTDAVDVVARYRDTQGEYRTLLTRRAVQRDDQGQPLAVLGVALDITERRQIERALEQARERAALATREAGIGTWERDLVHQNSHWDEQMYRLRGLSPQDPRPVEALRMLCVHPDDRAPMQAHYDRVRSGDIDRTAFEFRVVWPDGTERWLATRARVLRDAQGQPVRMIGVNWDITELKRSEQALRDKAAAEQANRAKSEFLARMSHELRTPLNAVLGFTQILQADAAEALSPRQRQRVDHIHVAGQHLLGLINDVLDLSRIESGMLDLVPEPFTWREVVEDALGLVEPMSRAHNVSLHLGDLSAGVVADRQRLRQVLMNLLSNAIKYNHPAGRVEIEARSPSGWRILSVRDTGRGMTPAQLNGLFEPFNRLGMEREAIEGTGIGLSIARQLVLKMGGRIEVRSTPGVGSVFEVWLPAGGEPQHRAPAGSPRSPQMSSAPLVPAAPNRAGCVLYIEDNEVNVLLLRELLALRPGVDFHAAADARTGVALAQSLRPDLVLVDMHLPDADGHEVLQRLKADPRTAGLRCIALSANAMPEDVGRALAAGFEDYWTKPIDVPRFLAALDQFMPG